MLVAPFMVTFADAVVRVTGDDSVTIGDVAKGDFSICIAHTNIPLTPSPTNEPTAELLYTHDAKSREDAPPWRIATVSVNRYQPSPSSAISLPGAPA